MHCCTAAAVRRHRCWWAQPDLVSYAACMACLLAVQPCNSVAGECMQRRSLNRACVSLRTAHGPGHLYCTAYRCQYTHRVSSPCELCQRCSEPKEAPPSSLSCMRGMRERSWCAMMWCLRAHSQWPPRRAPCMLLYVVTQNRIRS